MGTRGAFGVIIGEQEKIGYNQMDSYPGGYGVENLQWLREVVSGGTLEEVRALAEAAVVVSDEVKPTPEQVKALAYATNLNVSEQSTDDWYCLTRDTHGHIGKMLGCGFIEDHSGFPLNSLFCEWAYLVDFDAGVFEVYEGFQHTLPAKGRWAGRPTKAEDAADHKAHVAWCKANGREPWQPKVSEYKAAELVASWPFDALPSDEDFLAATESKEEVA